MNIHLNIPPCLLHTLTNKLKKNNLFIRILPTAASIQNAEKLEYLPKNIIAMQGPFSKEMNVAILKNYKID